MISNEEKETVCVFDYIDNKWEVYSCVPKHITKLSKIATPKWKREVGGKNGTLRVVEAKWTLNANQIRFFTEKTMSDEQKRIAAERMRKMHKQEVQ